MAQRDTFYRLLKDHTETMKSKQEHFSISTDKYNKIVQALRLQRGELCEDGSKFKMWCKKQFKLEQIGSRQIVYCIKESCPVVTYEEMFETIRKCHEKSGTLWKR